MTQLKPAGAVGALDNINATQNQFRTQIAALTELMRQVAGDAAISSGALAAVDPLSAPFTLYVNPYTGSDRFVGGSYNTHEEGTTDEEQIASKLKRLEQQRLVCGYTPQRPFRTINRAVIEAAIITSKYWYTFTDPRAHVDCVSIVLAPGVHTVYNDPGSAQASLTSWGDDKTPTTADLIAFNPATVGGVLLPRGCSLCGPDLRKTTLRPSWVPAAADEATDYSNRRGILKITGTGYFFGFTVMDKVGLNTSHHLLDAFHFASKAELDDFYGKVYSAVGTGGNLSQALTVTRGTEYQIVGPIVGGQTPTESWDTTASASPYIFNCSIRSDYGLGGAFMDGAKTAGLKSMVCANFTGVSLQKDMTCWQRYTSNAWTTTTYAQYIAADPDDIRMNPLRQSRHISAINDAFIQEVSVFAIGQGIHHFTDLGGEITVTNSNSSFGGCAAVSKGYKTLSFPQDKNWTVSRLKVPLDVSVKTGNVRRIFLGTIKTLTSGLATLDVALAVDSGSETTPQQLLRDSYTFKAGSYIWIENPSGADWKAKLASSAWNSSNPDRINITNLDSAALVPIDVINDNGDVVTINPAIGKRIYIRRLVDTRTPSERQVSLMLENTTAARIPERNFILQTDPAGPAINSTISTLSDNVLIVTDAGTGLTPGSGVLETAEITLRRGGSTNTYNGTSTFYRKGTVVTYNDKHFFATQDITTSTSAPDTKAWQECYVHMSSSYAPEDAATNSKLTIVFDGDSDTAETTTDCGYAFPAAYTSDAAVKAQYRSSTDYLGVYRFLRILGFTDSAAHAALLPQVEASRLRDPNSVTHFPTAPTGGVADGLGYWTVEFRRPSVLRLYGHAWEWAGFLNYSKAIPAAQRTLGAQNKFTYYFTNFNGGRVVPQGSNEDGFNITPRGLEDVETGTTLSVDNLTGGTIDDRVQTEFDNLSVKNLKVTDLLDAEGARLTGLDGSVATVNALGVGNLAEASRLRSLPGTQNFLVATGVTDAELNDSIEKGIAAGVDNRDGLITLKALNYWRLQQGLISAGTSVLYLYVKADYAASPKTLSQLLAAPPTDAVHAVSSLPEAAAYANYILAGSDRTAVIKIAPGVYDPQSDWSVNVQFESWNADFSERLFPSTTAGDINTANNYFDGSGYGDKTNAVNFWPFSLGLNDSAVSIGDLSSLTIRVAPRRMLFLRGVTFAGGFHFLGLPEMLKVIAGQTGVGSTQYIDTADFLPASILPEPGIYTTTVNINSPSSTSNIGSDAFTTNTLTNVDTFLNKFRIATGRSGVTNFASVVGVTPLLDIRSRSQDQVQINDIVFGPGLPGRKEQGGVRDPLVAVSTSVQLNMANIYLRGSTQITAAGIFGAGNVTDTVLPYCDKAHYGTLEVKGAWTWRQHYHTFLGTRANTTDTVTINRFGRNVRYKTGSNPNSYTYFKNYNPSKYLPNHIHLQSADGMYPTGTVASPAGTIPTSATDAGITVNNDGPFFDQFIHAKISLRINDVWNDYNSGTYTQDAGGSNNGSIYQGFIGRFGTPGYNSLPGNTYAHTRGVLIGNFGESAPECGCAVYMPEILIRSVGDTINSVSYNTKVVNLFQVAGGTAANRANFLPGYAFEPYSESSVPVSKLLVAGKGVLMNGSTNTYTTNNPVSLVDGGSTTMKLNAGLIPYLQGINAIGANTFNRSTVI